MLGFWVFFYLEISVFVEFQRRLRGLEVEEETAGIMYSQRSYSSAVQNNSIVGTVYYRSSIVEC